MREESNESVLLYSRGIKGEGPDQRIASTGVWRRSVLEVKSMLRNRWFFLSAAGLAACLILFGEGSGVSSRISVDTFAVMTSEDPLTGGIAIMAAFLLAVLCSRFAAGWIESKAFLVFDAMVNVAGVVMLLSDIVGISGIGFAEMLPRVGGLVLGFGSAWLLIRWAILLIPLGAKSSSLCFAVSLLMIIVFDILAKALVDSAFVVVIVLVCVASPVLLEMAKRSFNSGLHDPPIEEYCGVVPVWLSFATIALYAVVMGGIQVSGSSAISRFDGVAEILVYSGMAVDLGILIAAFVIFVGTRYLHGNNTAFYRLTILALLAVSLYLSAVLSANWGAMNIVIMTVSRMLIFVYVWTMFSTPARTMSPLRLFSVGWLLFLVINYLSTRIGQTVAGGSTGAPLVVFEFTLAAVLLLLFVFEFTPILTGWHGEAHSGEKEVNDGADAFALRIAELVDQGGLTPREQDVLVALARGRSAQYVADTFVVSKETARTHIRHVYQKLDVHSREELMDLVERIA